MLRLRIKSVVTASLVCVIAWMVECENARSQTDNAALVARWDFGSESPNRFDAHGEVLRDQAGPRSPEFPDFEANNTAIRLGAKGAYLSVADPSTGSIFDFTNGDAITLEGWVKMEGNVVGTNAPVYVVGKGRTGNPKVARDNQNWSLRLIASDGEAKIGFLFATSVGVGDLHWHRWTSNKAFKTAEGWHHVAVAYRFGEPDSVRGWIDGKRTEGNWDMGGKTTEPPVVDNDDVWIGSANVNNSFVGSLDAIAIHRTVLEDRVIASRFNRKQTSTTAVLAKPVMPLLHDVPSNRVVVTFAEGLPAADRWLNEGESWPEEKARWVGDSFLLPRIPRRYDDWGIRDDWKGPVLLRMAADVELEPGMRRFLMRARGLGRLWVDGQLVAHTKPVTRKSVDGEQPITPIAEPPMQGLRAHGYHQQEVFGEVNIEANDNATVRRCRVVLELVVGGTGQRIETGEVCVGLQTIDKRSFYIMTPSGVATLPMTDAAVEGELSRIEKSLASYDDTNRRKAASSQDAFWDERHEAARQWAAAQSTLQKSYDVGSANLNPIDGFIASKIERAVKDSQATDRTVSEKFHREVLPILRDQCFRCHGEKEKGGLRLNSREAALRAGESELPAVVPRKPDESELIAQVRSGAMPPTGTSLSEEQIKILEQWIANGAAWPSPPISEEQIAMPQIVDDATFVRRVYLDSIGLPPTVNETKRFLEDSNPHKRARLVEHLLKDEQVADHWVSYWQDVLAENPTLLNQSMGSTGPFRWFLHDALRDNKPIDRMVTELLMLRGSEGTGGSAAFALSGESDAPFAVKSHVVASAFLGIELQCARCHDSPYHSTTQRDLYSLSAMLQRKDVKVPATSRVPDAFFDRKGRESLIKVTLKPDESIAAVWPFATTTGIDDGPELKQWISNLSDSRERLAALVTAPPNQRFAKVLVNRVWKRLMGAAMVEPVDDWEGRSASHPEMLEWLANELVTHGYDLRHVMYRIMTSQAYMREASGENLMLNPEMRFFNAPDRRRLTAEQVVDSLFAVTGNTMDVEELTFVHDGQRPLDKRQTLGSPKRAWMFAALNNERDRPSLSLPKARTIVDVLEAFGWNGSRQKSISVRETDPNVLQPGVMANGTLTMSLIRASADSHLAQLAIAAESPAALVNELFMRVLCRGPKPEESAVFERSLATGFDSRLVAKERIKSSEPMPSLPLVTWFNHLQPETNTIQQERERRVTLGPRPDPRLASEWRLAYEDVVWSLINHREFIWMP